MGKLRGASEQQGCRVVSHGLQSGPLRRETECCPISVLFCFPWQLRQARATGIAEVDGRLELVYIIIIFVVIIMG